MNEMRVIFKPLFKNPQLSESKKSINVCVKLELRIHGDKL
jgi:hypothetical protein